MAISVTSDVQWGFLAQRVGLQDNHQLCSEAGRRGQRELVDQAVSRWTATQDAWTTAHQLQAMGIASGPVLNNKDLLLDPHLRQRGFYEYVKHPMPVGNRPVIGRPYQMRHRRPHIQGPAPSLGEHGQALLRDLPELSQEAAAHLHATTGQPTSTVIPGALDMREALRSRTVTELDEDYQQQLGI